MKKVSVAICAMTIVSVLCSFTFPISAALRFMSYDRYSGQRLQGVNLVIVNRDGKVIDTLITDDRGIAEKKISTFLDKRYLNGDKDGSFRRGTVTVIAYKEGYCETVLFEAPVDDSESFQPFTMYPIVTGQRNEPVVQIAENHHLVINELVEKYRRYFKGK